MQLTHEQKQQLRDEAKNGKVGIETLKTIQKFKAALIAEIHKTHKNLKEGKANAIGTIFGFMDDACFLARLATKYKDVFKEFHDLEAEERNELHLYFVECLKSEGFDVKSDSFEIVEAIDEFEFQLQEFLTKIAKFKK